MWKVLVVTCFLKGGAALGPEDLVPHCYQLKYGGTHVTHELCVAERKMWHDSAWLDRNIRWLGMTLNKRLGGTIYECTFLGYRT